MAKPIPCIRCETAADSSWLLTARDDLTGMEPGTTLALCAGCWPAFVVELATAIVETGTVTDDAVTADDAAAVPVGDPTGTHANHGDAAGADTDDTEAGEPPPKSNGKTSATPAGAQRAKVATSTTPADD